MRAVSYRSALCGSGEGAPSSHTPRLRGPSATRAACRRSLSRSCVRHSSKAFHLINLPGSAVTLFCSCARHARNLSAGGGGGWPSAVMTTAVTETAARHRVRRAWHGTEDSREQQEITTLILRTLAVARSRSAPAAAAFVGSWWSRSDERRQSRSRFPRSECPNKSNCRLPCGALLVDFSSGHKLRRPIYGSIATRQIAGG